MVKRESCPSKIGPINLGTKQTGAPSAGNLHAGCDAAGAGNGFTVWLLRHSQRKRGATDRPDLRNTAPVLDPTDFAEAILSFARKVRFSVKWPPAGRIAPHSRFRENKSPLDDHRAAVRSEERRVGKECRSRWSP